MFISYFDDSKITEKSLTAAQKKLNGYQEHIEQVTQDNDLSVPECSLTYCKDFALHEELLQVKKKFKNVKHLILVGIGGSSLGLEAVHAVLDDGKVELSVLDAISAHSLDLLLQKLLALKSIKNVAICVVSKSGKTTETLANAAVLLETLQSKFGEAVYAQTVFIGDTGSPLQKYAKLKSSWYIAMPNSIGGRYSMATAVGLVPLTILGHDVDDFIAGYLDASLPRYESLVADSAARISLYHQLKYQHYNFFAFEPRLEKLGRWYRQLFAESLGKETTTAGKSVALAMVPTISTPVELHSVGQLYLSGVPKTFTDFVTFDDELIDIKIPKTTKLASSMKSYTLQEISTGLYGGVIAAYQERKLPYRTTIFEESLPYSLGLFMAMRLREVMYTAHLLQVNAFDQPNVELYKVKTKEILSL